MTFLVILLVVGSVEEGIVGEETLCGNLHCFLVDIIVRVAGVVVYALLDLKNLNGEDRCLAVSETVVCRLENVLHNHSALGRCVCAVVEGRERNLSACAAVHCVEVVDESLHRLECSSVCLGLSVLESKALELARELFTVFLGEELVLGSLVVGAVVLELGPFASCFLSLVADSLGDFLCVLLLAEQLNRSLEVLAVTLAVCLCYTGSHRIIKVRNALTAVLVVLVGLNSDTSERRVGLNIIGLSEVAVTC